MSEVQEETIQKFANHNLFREPEFRPRIKAWRYQWIGFPLILAIPILAILNVFGLSMDEQHFSKDGLSIKTEFPGVMRHGQVEYLRLEITNQSESNLENVKVHFAPLYLKKFDEVEFSPPVEENYVVNLGSIQEGTTKYLDLRLRAGKRGNYQGDITVLQNEKLLYETNIKTHVLP